MAYKGIIRGNVIELEDEVGLPEGTEVEVEVKESPVRGNPQAILAHWRTSPQCTSKDVDALTQAIELGRKNVRFEGVFDQAQGTPYWVQQT